MNLGAHVVVVLCLVRGANSSGVNAPCIFGSIGKEPHISSSGLTKKWRYWSEGVSQGAKKIVSSTHIVQATGKQVAHISTAIYHWIQRGLQIPSGNILLLATFRATHEEHLADKTWVLKSWSIISTYIVLKNSIPNSEKTHGVSIIRAERLALNNERMPGRSWRRNTLRAINEIP